MSIEFDYFDDPRISKLLDLTLHLATELHAVRQRERALEYALVRHGVLAEGELDAFRPSESEARILDCERDRYTRRLVRIITEAGPAEQPLRSQWKDALAEKAG